MPGVSVDGMVLGEVFVAASTALHRARAGDGPSLIETRSYRFFPNTSNDDDTRYRPREEVEGWRQRDPIALLRQKLLEDGSIEESELARIEAEVADEVAEAAAWAEAQPDPEPEASLQHTWAERLVEVR
jgi:TPP-dependent pyruvate/acetoin dehydrogenase alpha subunit